MSIALPVALGAERYDLLDYYHPMVAGNEWVYESQQGSSTWTTTCRILNASVLLNCYSNCAPVVPYTRSAASVVFDQGGGNTWTNFMHVGAPGFGYVGFDHVDGARLRFGPEFIYTNRFALGQMVSVADEVYSGGVCSGQGSQSIRLLGLADVTVPYGSFTDCLHLEITSSIGGSTTVDESWWAKGMGPVKWTHGGGGDFETNELRAVSFAETVRLVDYYPLPLNGHWLYQGLDWDGFPAKSVRRVDATNTLLTLYTGRNPATSYTTNVISEYNSYVDSTTLVPYDEWTSYMAAGSSFGYFGDSGAGDIRLDRGGILPEFMAVGDSITNVVDAYIAGTFVGTVSFIFQVLEHTALTVPAGTFPEVLRVRIATVTPGDAGAHDEWWAKSVGSIKQAGVSGDGMIEQWELIEYSVPLPPAIETQPEDRTNSIGTTATFQVGAVGAEPLAYQWRFNGTNLSNGGRVAGATSPTLTLFGVQTNDAGNYTVVVTNAYGSVTSSVAVLTVTGTSLPPMVSLLDYYYPIVAGNQWIYDAEGIWDGSPNAMWRVDSASIPLTCYTGRNPVRTYTQDVARLYAAYGTDHGASFSPTDEWYDYQVAAGWGFAGYDDDTGTMEMRLDPRIVITNQVFLGQTFLSTNDIYVNGVYTGQMTFELLISEQTIVAVPAGTYPDCLHIQYTVTQPEETQTNNEWWAKGVGMVRKTRNVTKPGQSHSELYELKASAFVSPPLDAFVGSYSPLIESHNNIRGFTGVLEQKTNLTLTVWQADATHYNAGLSDGVNSGSIPSLLLTGNRIQSVTRPVVLPSSIVLDFTMLSDGTNRAFVKIGQEPYDLDDISLMVSSWSSFTGSVTADDFVGTWDVERWGDPNLRDTGGGFSYEELALDIQRIDASHIQVIIPVGLTLSLRVSGNQAFLESPPVIAGNARYHAFHVCIDGKRMSFHTVASELNDLTDVSVAIGLGVKQTPFVWAKRVASTVNPDAELSIGMTLDSQGNVYVTGWFDGTNDFGGVTLTNQSGGGQDIFVAKYDSGGALQWARRAGGNTETWDVARGVGVDRAGNVYVTGGFYGAADFGTFNLIASQNEDFFLAKYDSTGTVQWVRQNAGGGRSAYGTGLAVDGAGNNYAVGYFDGSGVTFGTTTLVNPGRYNVFLVKYDNTGAVQWAQLMGSPDRTYATKVAVDASGNVYVHGGFSMHMTIGTSNLVSAGERDMFLAKFDSAGALLWVRQEGGTGDDGGEGGVAVDPDGNVYATGPFGSSPMNLGNTSLLNAGSLDTFIAKYNSSGALQWARQAGGTNLDIYWDVALDELGNAYAAGALGSDAVAPDGSGGAMVAKYDPAGTLQWAYSASGPPADPVGSIVAKCAVDSAGNCYLAGWYQGTVTFGTNVLQPQGYWNYFLARLSPGSDSLEFGGLTISDGAMQVRLDGMPGTSVILDLSFDLETWTPWQTNTLPAGGLDLVLPIDTNGQFIRARLAQ